VTETRQRTESNEDSPSRGLSTCYRCGATLSEETQHCPQCGRRQTRLCHCGNAIPVTASECPYCHADWSAGLKVRRKSLSCQMSWKLLLVHAVAGSLVTVALAAMANSAVGALALRSLPPGQRGLPGAFSARFELALTTLGRGLSTLLGKLTSIGGSPWIVFTIAGTGAAVGAVCYLYRIGSLRIRWPLGNRRLKRRRRRGTY